MRKYHTSERRGLTQPVGQYFQNAKADTARRDCFTQPEALIYTGGYAREDDKGSN